LPVFTLDFYIVSFGYKLLIQYTVRTPYTMCAEKYMVQATGYNRGFEPLTFALISKRSGPTTELLQSPLNPLLPHLIFSYWLHCHTSLFPRSSPPTCATPPFALVFPLFRSPLAPLSDILVPTYARFSRG
jgi:hypothetical protein